MNLTVEHWLLNIHTEKFITQLLGGVRVKCDVADIPAPVVQPLMDPHPVVLPSRGNYYHLNDGDQGVHIWVPITPIPKCESLFPTIVGVQPMSDCTGQFYKLRHRSDEDGIA